MTNAKNAKITFESHDCFNRIDFAKKIYQTIEYNCPFTEDSFVVSLNAPFGRGKTTFVKMFENFLQEKERDEIVISLNAWETDFAKNPLIAILSEILEKIKKIEDKYFEDGQKSVFNKDHFTKTVRATIRILGEFAKNYSPAVKSAIETAQKTGTIINEECPDIDQQFFQAKEQYQKLRELLGKFIAKTNKKRLIIIIDELDRCRPNYAIEFLEAIKHIFAIKGIIFILAVNKEQLQASTRALFGDIKFDEYYRRFISRQIELKAGEIIDYEKFNKNLFTKYQENKPADAKELFKDQNKESNFLKWTTQLFTYFKLEPRQIESFYKDFSYLSYRKKEYQNGYDASLPFVKGLSFLLVLRITNNALFDLLLTNYDQFVLNLIEWIKGYQICFKKPIDTREYDDKWLLGLELLSCCITDYPNRNLDRILELGRKNFIEADNQEGDMKMCLGTYANKNESINLVNIARRILELKTIEDI